jgi:hypothetical protein
MGPNSTANLSTVLVKFAAALQWLVLTTTVAAFNNSILATDTWAQIYRGKVVDAETGQPLEGAVFVIVWTKKPLVTMDGPEYFHSATEALTDSKGEFSVDGSPGVDWNPFTYVRNHPSIAIFVPGYGPFPTGHVKDMPTEEMEKAMTGAGSVIKLPKLKTQEEMRRFASPGTLQISTGTPYEDIPNLVRLINIHRKLAGLSSQIGPPAH